MIKEIVARMLEELDYCREAKNVLFPPMLCGRGCDPLAVNLAELSNRSRLLTLAWLEGSRMLDRPQDYSLSVRTRLVHVNVHRVVSAVCASSA